MAIDAATKVIIETPTTIQTVEFNRPLDIFEVREECRRVMQGSFRYGSTPSIITMSGGVARACYLKPSTIRDPAGLSVLLTHRGIQQHFCEI